MTRRRKKLPLIRQGLFFLGILLIVVSPLVGAIPGPGGVFVFAAGLALILQNSEWAKRQYVKFKRKHPNKGRWADWGMRRLSARRREARMKRAQAEQTEAGGASVSDLLSRQASLSEPATRPPATAAVFFRLRIPRNER